MSDRQVVMFMFAGRRGNLELNIPMIRRILEQHPRVEFHLWNLARTTSDSGYVQTIRGDRVVMCGKFGGPAAYRRLPRVWEHYISPRFKDCLFVKIDDDVVFLETDRFGVFLDAVESNPETVISADVINNGACTKLTPDLWDGFQKLGIPLLDVHMSNDYATMAHEYMLEHWLDLIEQPPALIDNEDWLSINMVGMHWPMLCRISEKIGRRSPAEIAGRLWHPTSRIGDEGAVNMFPRAILRGFTVAHLGFGPQELTAEQEDQWRERYAAIRDKYIGGWLTVPS